MSVKKAIALALCAAATTALKAQVSLTFKTNALDTGALETSVLADPANTKGLQLQSGSGSQYDNAFIKAYVNGGKFTTFSRQYHGSTVAGFSTGNRWFANVYAFSNFRLPLQTVERVDSTGQYILGFRQPRISFSLAAATGNNKDSIRFQAKAVPFSRPQVALKFPLEVSKAWQTHNRTDLDFRLDINAFFIKDAPGQVRTYLDQRDTVVGDGQIRISGAGHKTSVWYNSVLVQRRVMRTDSFFLNGDPAPKILLQEMGLTQGQKTYSYDWYFIREKSLNPVLDASATDSTFTAYDPNNVYFDYYGVDLTTALDEENISQRAQAKIYPTIVTGGCINFSGITSHSQINISILNMAGQQVDAQVLKAGAQQIQLPANLENGEYLLRATDKGGALNFSSKFSVQH